MRQVSIWKKVKNVVARNAKVVRVLDGISTYHLLETVIRVHSNNLRPMEYSMTLLEEHNR
jgi:hypothetical protein